MHPKSEGPSDMCALIVPRCFHAGLPVTQADLDQVNAKRATMGAYPTTSGGVDIGEAKEAICRRLGLPESGRMESADLVYPPTIVRMIFGEITVATCVSDGVVSPGPVIKTPSMIPKRMKLSHTPIVW